MNRAVAGIIGLLALLGVVAGAVWAAVVTTPMVTRDRTGLVTEGVELGKRVDADVWFALLGVGFGLPAGAVVVALALRRGRPDPLVALVALVAGAALASLLCLLVGTVLGPPDPASVLEDAAPGARAPEVLTTHTWVVHLVWPLAVSLGALLALVTRSPQQQRVSRSDEVADNPTS